MTAATPVLEPHKLLGRPTAGGQRPGQADMVCIVRRMPRMQVYLPDDLYQQVKARRLPASELLQEAVRAEIRRQDLLAEVGAPSPQERAHAEAMARRIAARPTPRAG